MISCITAVVAGEIEALKANWTCASKLHPTGVTGHSAQRGADLLKLTEYRQRKGEPGKFAFMPMPHIRQGYNNCGFAGHTRTAS